MNIMIGGDLAPCGVTERLFEAGAIKKAIGDSLFDVWEEASYKIFNLECPITKSTEKITKCGPNLKCSPETILGIKELSPTLIMLANNHILDYSERGLKDTIKILEKNKINWVGVGDDINNLKKCFSFLCDDKKITVYNCCEHEFSIVSKKMCGANPYDSETIDGDIKEAKVKSDYLIVIYHGGKECYRYPSPELQRRCRKMVKNGADLVVCQHSHCIGCKEEYNNGTIVYGQGNFIFTTQRNMFWATSLLINIDVSDGFNIKYIPIVQTEYGTRLADKKEFEKIIRDFLYRSDQIKDDKFIESTYKKYADEQLGNYLIKMNNNRITLRIVRKLFPGLFSKMRFNYAAILNSIECEAHRELFIKGLKNKIAERKDNK